MKFFIIFSVFPILVYNGVLADNNYELLGTKMGVRDCYGVTCPEGTVVCNKLSKSSQDLQYVDTIIKCEDNNGNTLNIDNQRSVNPFPGTRYSSFSYQGNYRIRLNPRPLQNSGREDPNPIYNSNVNPTYYSKNNDVEVF